MNNNKLLKTVFAGLLLALAYVLPFITGQIPEIGSRLCPMHIPILLCGFICGPYWGLATGFAAPLFRSLTLGVPLLYPSAVCMAFELAVYGAVSGLMHKILPRKKPYVYLSLIIAMLAGRLVWGAVMFLCMGADSGAFGMSAFVAGAFTNAIPGIILQLVLVPVIVMVFDSSKKFSLKSGNDL